jgi:hypothetical protein
LRDSRVALRLKVPSRYSSLVKSNIVRPGHHHYVDAARGRQVALTS